MRGWIVWSSLESCLCCPAGGMGHANSRQTIRGEEFHAKENWDSWGRSRWDWPRWPRPRAMPMTSKIALPGPIDSISDLQDTAKMVFKLADTNNDGQISQKEAIDAGQPAGRRFFLPRGHQRRRRVDPARSPAGARALFAQQPLLKFVLERAKPTNVRREPGPERSADRGRNGQRPAARRPEPGGRPDADDRATCSTPTTTRRSKRPSCARRSRPGCRRCS